MEDFLADLDKSMSKVGSTVVWKKTFGDVVIWLSPLTLEGQGRITDLIANADQLGVGIINETKRVTLSNAIVGINDYDLREHRDGAPAFPGIGRDGKKTQLTLEKFIYQKLSSWSSQLVDDIFSVLGDLLESHQKENLSGIKFENAKDPEVELAELEERASELREKLGKPQLTEMKAVKPVSNQSIPETHSVEPKAPVVEVAFDPFAAIAVKERASDRMVQPPQPPPVQPQFVQPVQPQPVQPQPVQLVQDSHSPRREVIDPAQELFNAPLEREVNTAKGAVTAHVAFPSVSSDVVEPRMAVGPVAPPVIDPGAGGTNPRFKPRGLNGRAS